MMKRIIDADMTTYCKKAETAINRFFKKYPELKHWKEMFEYMAEHNQDFECDNVWSDGSKNNDWTFALHFDNNGDSFYMCVIEREFEKDDLSRYNDFDLERE